MTQTESATMTRPRVGQRAACRSVTLAAGVMMVLGGVGCRGTDPSTAEAVAIERPSAPPATTAETSSPPTGTAPSEGAAPAEAAEPTPAATPRPSAPSTTDGSLINMGVDPTYNPGTDPPMTPLRSEVQRALSARAAAVRACGNGVPGVVSVAVTFASDGHVTGAVVSGDEHADRACIAAAVRSARLPRFGASRFRVIFPYRI